MNKKVCDLECYKQPCCPRKENQLLDKADTVGHRTEVKRTRVMSTHELISLHDLADEPTDPETTLCLNLPLRKLTNVFILQVSSNWIFSNKVKTAQPKHLVFSTSTCDKSFALHYPRLIKVRPIIWSY